MMSNRGWWTTFIIAALVVALLGWVGWLPSQRADGAERDDRASAQQRPDCGESQACIDYEREASDRRKARRHYQRDAWGQRRGSFRVLAAHPRAWRAFARDYRRGVNRYQATHRGEEAARVVQRFARFARSTQCSIPIGAGLQSSQFWCMWTQKEDELLQPVRDKTTKIVIDCGGAYAAAWTTEGVYRKKFLAAMRINSFTSSIMAGCVVGHLVQDILNGILND